MNGIILLHNCYFIEPLWSQLSCSHLWPFRDVFSTVSNESDSLHAGVRKSCVAHELWQTLHCILERINSSCKMLLEGVHWGKSDEEKEGKWENKTELVAGLICCLVGLGDLKSLLSFILTLKQDWGSVSHNLNRKELRKELQSYSLTMCPVVWKASSTIVSSWSEAAWWNTEKMFFQPERMLAAWEFTIWATHLITMSLIVGDLREGRDELL